MKRITLILTALGALLLVSAAPASADPPHTLLGNFGSVAAGGTGSEPSFASPGGMAVDQATGDVLAIHFNPSASGSIERFKPDGTADPFSALGTNVIDGKRSGGTNECPTVPADCDETPGNEGILSNEGAGSEVEIAVAPPTALAGTAGNIFATDAEHGGVDVFSSAGAYLTQFSGVYPCGVAVAPNGNVFVGDYSEGKVFKLVPSGPSSYVKSITGFSTTHPCQVAATEGFVFAAEFEGPAKKIDSEGAEEGTTKYTVDSGANLALNVDPSDGHLYTAPAEGVTTKVKEYDVSGASPVLIEPSIEPGNLVAGIAINGTSGNVYVRRGGNTKIEVYGPRAAPKFNLNPSTSGGEGGTLQCDTGSGPGACAAEYEEGKVVTVTTTPNAGSTFSEWSGDCTGSGSCVVTMDAEKSVVAHFSLASESFEVEQIGSNGTVECEDNGGGLATCAASYLYGHTIKVVATPESVEYALGALTGTGSAAGNCNKETGVCEFVIHATSKVTAKFESAGKKAEFTGNVHGEVKAKTALENTADCEDVDLGIFDPGVAATYPGFCTVTATSTGGETELSAEDEQSGIHKGHLENTAAGPGTPYYLEEPLKVQAVGFGPLSALTSSVLLRTYEAPVYKHNEELEFSQQIKAGEALRTGVYAKTITLTLEQTTP